jgi:hypothetical protein
MTDHDDDRPAPPPKIIDLLAILTGRKPRRYALLGDEDSDSDDPADEPTPLRPRFQHEQPQPLTLEEAPYYRELPLDDRGAPMIRSEVGAFIAEQANGELGRVALFSFEDDVNARHFIARYERAGLLDLADDHRRKLADYQALEAANGPFRHPEAKRDYGSEQLLSRLYGTPEEDRARLIRFLRRDAEIEAARRRGLPGRYSAYELV